MLIPTLVNNTRGLGARMHNSNEAKQRCQQKHASITSKYQFSGRHDSQYNAHGLRSWLAVKLPVKDVEVKEQVRMVTLDKTSHNGESL